MSGRRVSIIDASHILTLHSISKSPDGLSSTFSKSQSQRPAAENELGVLQPIPGLRDLLRDAVKTAGPRVQPGKIAQIDVGLICGVDAVQFVGRGLHERVLRHLKESVWVGDVS